MDRILNPPVHLASLRTLLMSSSPNYPVALIIVKAAALPVVSSNGNPNPN